MKDINGAFFRREEEIVTGRNMKSLWNIYYSKKLANKWAKFILIKLYRNITRVKIVRFI